MKRWIEPLVALLMGALLPLQAGAQAAIKPAVVYSTGGKFDKSFNEGVSAGAEQFKKETGIAFAEFEPSNETQFEQALRRFAQRGQMRGIAGIGAQPHIGGRRVDLACPLKIASRNGIILHRPFRPEAQRADGIEALAGPGLAGGEPGLDLGVCLAVVSAVRDHPLAADLAVFGEVGLGGELRIQQRQRDGGCLLRAPKAKGHLDLFDGDGLDDHIVQRTVTTIGCQLGNLVNHLAADLVHHIVDFTTKRIKRGNGRAALWREE